MVPRKLNNIISWIKIFIFKLLFLLWDSHIDLGFANTYDQYYYGEGEIVGVVKVIDSIIEGLVNHPYRKYVEKKTIYYHTYHV